MPPENVWSDPRTLISIGSLGLGVLGFLFGILSFRWNRRESRLDALSKILQPLVKAAQHLHDANTCRRTCEQLKASFPVPEAAPEATQRVAMMAADYGVHVKEARDAFRLGESELASRSFRFPDKVAKLVGKAVESLSEFGRLVNGGIFDKADLQFVKFRDDYGQITKVGRGWRLADPLEGIKRYFRKKKHEAAKSRYDLTECEMDAILELVHKRATSQARNTFAVHPPKKLLDRPEIAQSETAIEQLDQSVFVAVFQDGTSKKMSFVELMVFTFNLIVLAQQYHDVTRMMLAVPEAPRDIKVSVRFSINEIMRPEMVRFLLSKISFSTVASDGAQPDCAA